jgi:hypothetical protein
LAESYLASLRLLAGQESNSADGEVAEPKHFVDTIPMHSESVLSWMKKKKGW